MRTFAKNGPGTITAVVPMHNIAVYLPEFLASIVAQRGGLRHVEFIFVDDGSPDDAARIVADWIAAHPKLNAQLLRKPNGGLSSARNAGLELATGEWVTFPDPDDVLSRDYFAELVGFVRSPAAERVHIVAGRFIYLNEDTGTTSDRRGMPHPGEPRQHGRRSPGGSAGFVLHQFRPAQALLRILRCGECIELDALPRGGCERFSQRRGDCRLVWCEIGGVQQLPAILQQRVVFLQLAGLRAKRVCGRQGREA